MNTLQHTEIISRFLTLPAQRFVRQVEAESDGYTKDPRSVGKPGFLKRDRVRFKLTDRAYRRYAKTI